MGRRLVRWLAWWTALFFLWLLLAGDWNGIELASAALAAAVAATLSELAFAVAGTRLRFDPAWVARAWSLPFAVVADFMLLAGALVASAARREVRRGGFRTRRLVPRIDEAGSRALAAVLATYSPASYVVEIGRERVVLHDLVPGRGSESPL